MTGTKTTLPSKIFGGGLKYILLNGKPVVFGKNIIYVRYGKKAKSPYGRNMKLGKNFKYGKKGKFVKSVKFKMHVGHLDDMTKRFNHGTLKHGVLNNRRVKKVNIFGLDDTQLCFQIFCIHS